MTFQLNFGKRLSGLSSTRRLWPSSTGTIESFLSFIHVSCSHIKEVHTMTYVFPIIVHTLADSLHVPQVKTLDWNTFNILMKNYDAAGLVAHLIRRFRAGLHSIPSQYALLFMWCSKISLGMSKCSGDESHIKPTMATAPHHVRTKVWRNLAVKLAFWSICVVVLYINPFTQFQAHVQLFHQ